MSPKSWLIHRYWRLMDAMHAPFRKPSRSPEFTRIFPDFLDRLARLPSPTVLEVGSRNVTGADNRAHFTMAGRYIGCDIHPGPGVDVVIDAHRLSEAAPAGSVDAVYSVSVFEHLAYPWKVVMEINRLLKPGGLVYVSTHPVWPEHELPWDFWRFPVAGLRQLFAEPAGFRIIAAAEGVPCKLYALEGGAHLRNFAPLFVNAGVALIAEKVADFDPERLRWDVDMTRAVTTEYPQP